MDKIEFSIEKHQVGEGWSSVDRMPLREWELQRIIAALTAERCCDDVDAALAGRLWEFAKARRTSAFPAGRPGVDDSFSEACKEAGRSETGVFYCPGCGGRTSHFNGCGFMTPLNL